LIKAITASRSILGHGIEVKSQLWQDWKVDMPEQMQFNGSFPCPSESNLAHRHQERKHMAGAENTTVASKNETNSGHHGRVGNLRNVTAFKKGPDQKLQRKCGYYLPQISAGILYLICK
jgi:hypothetical protein